ncbi:hypothetical protein BO70DRAFT_387714 [Aspergillus heteromorphus CBS 117.55]|uniref:Uncharacterized protein n=1 Tax=Aspergillus heteromorphus CBS 117.55 TaxID=1448321 RepID=A0A317W1P9_9EURO|nr:uncharacterized protein BO70DRAFT_387714 [Aspergillus heteromorphus CBS 117.55]PWY79531.1 hypothetical protein BO70DRAFT_387714 [Aspergillus heteromorphus CBS 117.55]
MDWDRNRRFDDHRGGESYRPAGSRGYLRRSRSPRVHSPRLVADTWVPPHGRTYGRARSRSPPVSRRRSPSFYSRDTGNKAYVKACSPPRRFSPRRSEARNRSPPQVSWRSRTPYGESRRRDISWGRNTPKRPRDPSPRSQDFRYPRRERHPSSADSYMKSDISFRNSGSRAPLPHRSRSPFQGARRDRNPDISLTPKNRSPSPKGASPLRASTSGSLPGSRRSSSSAEKFNMMSSNIHSRSPTHHNSYGGFSGHLNHLSSREDSLHVIKDRPTTEDRPPTEDRPHTEELRHRSPILEQPMNRGQCIDTLGLQQHSETHEIASQPNPVYPRNVPLQPKAYSNSLDGQTPPSGPSNGPKTMSLQNRAPNISLLSAPTRPRGSPGFKEAPWSGSPARRGPSSTGLRGPPPTGPRSSILPTGPGVELSRPHLNNRQSSLSGPSYPPRIPRHTSHLAGLRPIIPDGKLLPSSLDVATDKRLSQLDADKDKIFDQIGNSQILRRLGIRDWDRLDRESSICALKSELAEGHLQCIADVEGVHVGAMF